MLRIVNKHFYESTTAERFATLFFGIYDDRTRKMRYVNCGHCPPFLLRANGEIDRLGPTATPLGAFADWDCREAEAELRVGDTLLLYSDGVTEAGIEGVEEFGEDRLAHALRVNQWQPAEALVQAIVDDVADYSAGSRSDDVTVVGLRGI
jgi:sigma-B regulation protein RsbU (phosphoserine phosphatase)